MQSRQAAGVHQRPGAAVIMDHDIVTRSGAGAGAADSIEVITGDAPHPLKREDGGIAHAAPGSTVIMQGGAVLTDREDIGRGKTPHISEPLRGAAAEPGTFSGAVPERRVRWALGVHDGSRPIF